MPSDLYDREEQDGRRRKNCEPTAGDKAFGSTGDSLGNNIMKKSRMLSLDIGTSSVRAFEGMFDGERLELKEFDRFYHTPVYTPVSVNWDMLGIYQNIEKNGSKSSSIRRACQQYIVRLLGDGYGSPELQGRTVDEWCWNTGPAF